MSTIRFRSWACRLEFARYGNGRTALRLLDERDGGVVAIATVNVREAALGPDEVLVKDYSENEGMLEVLTRHGVVEATGRVVPTGYANAHVCRLLAKP
jgi:hypothetical protein